MQHNWGTIKTALGALQACTPDLAMPKLPIVMGECPRAVLERYRGALQHVGRVLPRTPPCCAVATRVVTVFALTKADFVFDAVPVMGIDLGPHEALRHQGTMGLPR